MFLSNDKEERQLAREKLHGKRTSDEKKRRAELSKIIVTTGDLNRGYDVIGPVFFEYSNSNLAQTYQPFVDKYKKEIKDLEQGGNKESHKKWEHLYGKHCSKMPQNEKAFYVGVQQLKERAYLLGGDAVISMKQETTALMGSFSPYFYTHFYGTVIKFRKVEVFE